MNYGFMVLKKILQTFFGGGVDIIKGGIMLSQIHSCPKPVTVEEVIGSDISHELS